MVLGLVLGSILVLTLVIILLSILLILSLESLLLDPSKLDILECYFYIAYIVISFLVVYAYSYSLLIKSS